MRTVKNSRPDNDYLGVSLGNRSEYVAGRGKPFGEGFHLHARNFRITAASFSSTMIETRPGFLREK